MSHPDRSQPHEQPRRAGWLLHSFRRVFSIGGARAELSVQVADLSALTEARADAIARLRQARMLPHETPALPAATEAAPAIAPAPRDGLAE